MQRTQASTQMREQVLLTQHHTFLEQHDRPIEIAEDLLTEPDHNGHLAILNQGVAVVGPGGEAVGLQEMLEAHGLCVQHWASEALNRSGDDHVTNTWMSSLTRVHMLESARQ